MARSSNFCFTDPQDPPWDAVYEVARDERLGALGEKIVHVRNLEAGDLEHVAKMLSREQR